MNFGVIMLYSKRNATGRSKFHRLEFRLEKILVFRHKAVGIVDDVAGVVFHTELEPALRTYFISDCRGKKPDFS